jgi:type III restriction enzyme
MKLKFKQQGFQADAVMAVVDYFHGQPFGGGIGDRIDPGRKVEAGGQLRTDQELTGFKNSDLAIPPSEVLKNIHDDQQQQNLPASPSLKRIAVCDFNLDIEMEMGMGKTYCYIKSMFEVNVARLLPFIAGPLEMQSQHRNAPLIDHRRIGIH